MEVTQSQKQATPDEIVAIAKKIWKRITASGVAASDEAGNDKLYDKMYAEFKDFGTSFPLVLKWMVMARKFSSKALRQYLLRHAHAKLDTRQDFLELQAEYLVLLYRADHPHANEAFIKTYRQGLVRHLVDEDKEFQAMHTQVEKEIDEREAKIDRERREALYLMLMAQKTARERAEPASAPAAEPAAAPAAGPAAEPAAAPATEPAAAPAAEPAAAPAAAPAAEPAAESAPAAGPVTVEDYFGAPGSAAPAAA